MIKNERGKKRIGTLAELFVSIFKHFLSLKNKTNHRAKMALPSAV